MKKKNILGVLYDPSKKYKILSINKSTMESRECCQFGTLPFNGRVQSVAPLEQDGDLWHDPMPIATPQFPMVAL